MGSSVAHKQDSFIGVARENLKKRLMESTQSKKQADVTLVRFLEWAYRDNYWYKLPLRGNRDMDDVERSFERKSDARVYVFVDTYDIDVPGS